MMLGDMGGMASGAFSWYRGLEGRGGVDLMSRAFGVAIESARGLSMGPKLVVIFMTSGDVLRDSMSRLFPLA